MNGGLLMWEDGLGRVLRMMILLILRVVVSGEGGMMTGGRHCVAHFGGRSEGDCDVFGRAQSPGGVGVDEYVGSYWSYMQW
jgi:hypothetical protein